MNSFEYKNSIWKWFWIASFIIQFLLFRTYCYREIISYIPENMDQVGYIGITYNIYDMFLQGKVLQCLDFAINNGVNSGMMLIGAINLFVFGFTRFSLLLPNFIAFFLCEITISGVCVRITKSRYAALIFQGLFLMTEAIFAAVGGIFDYRWDFLAFCVYTIWLAYLLEYLYTNERCPFFCSAATGGILLFIRLNTVLYLGSILFIVIIAKLLLCLKGERKSCLIDWLKYSGVLLLTGGWYLLINFRNFFNYYFSALFTSSSREAWQIHMNMKDNLLFYPKLLWTALVGKRQMTTIIILCVVAITLLSLSKKSTIKNKKFVLFTLLLAWIVPYGILTAMDNKNSAAAMILISSLLLCPIFLLGDVGDIGRKVFPVIAFAIVLMGQGGFLLNMMSSYPYHTKEDAQGYVMANDIVAEYMKVNDMDSAEIIFDRLHGNFFPNTIEVYSRETKERSVSITYAINSMKKDYLMSQFDDDEIVRGLEKADFLVINKYEYTVASNFNTDLILEKNRELLKIFAEENMYLVGEVSCGGNELKIYAKPILTVETEWYDWLGQNNTDIDIRNVQEEMTFLVLEGEYGYSLADHTVYTVNQNGRSIPAELTTNEAQTKYRIKIDISNCDMQHDKIHLTFGSCFVPQELFESEDNRKLTVCYPSEVYLEKGGNDN